MLFPQRPIVKTKQDFAKLLFEMLDHNDAVKWENDTVFSYLQAMAGWLADADGFYRNIGENLDTAEPSWQLFADMLQAAACYE